MEKEASLLHEIERLELANEQLIQGAPDSDLQQLQVEVGNCRRISLVTKP